MAKKVIIRLTNTDQVTWLIANETGAVEKPLVTESLAAAAENFHTHHSYTNDEIIIIVIVPGTEVLLTQVTLPTVQRKNLTATISYALEDQLIEDAEDYHYAFPEKLKSNTSFPVAVIAKEKWQQWLSQLQAVNIQPHYIIPEMLAIDYIVQAWHIYIESDVAIIRTGLDTGFAIDRLLLDTVLQEQLKKTDSERPGKIVLSNLMKKSTRLTKYPVPIEKRFPKNMLEQTAALSTLTLNLLPPKQIPRGKSSRAQHIWQIASYLIIACVVLNLLTIVTSYFYFHYQNTNLKQKIASIYLQNFPGSTVADDNDAQLQAKLEELEGAVSGGKFLQLLAKSGSQIKEYGTITGLNFEGAQLQLTLRLHALANYENLLIALRQKNLTVTGREKDGILQLDIGDKQ